MISEQSMTSVLLPHFTHEESKAQRGQTVCPTISPVLELVLDPGQTDSTQAQHSYDSLSQAGGKDVKLVSGTQYELNIQFTRFILSPSVFQPLLQSPSAR